MHGETVKLIDAQSKCLDIFTAKFVSHTHTHTHARTLISYTYWPSYFFTSFSHK